MFKNLSVYKIIFYVNKFQHNDLSLLVCKQTINNCKKTTNNYNNRFQHTDIKYVGMFQPVVTNCVHSMMGRLCFYMCLSICLSTPGEVPQPGPGRGGTPGRSSLREYPCQGVPTSGTPLLYLGVPPAGGNPPWVPPVRPGQGGTPPRVPPLGPGHLR